MLGLSCQLLAQRIVHAIAKPRNNADEAIRPPRVEERSSRPRRRPHIRALPVAAFGPTHTRAEPKPGWDGAFRAICCVAPLANGDPPLASRRFVHLIPESLRRDHAGLMQRFPNRTFGARRSSRPCPWRYAAARRRCAHAWEP